MAVIGLSATVLHAQDYLESSRIYRLLTPDAGVISVVARGIRRSGSRSTPPADLFAGGIAQVDLRPARDLHGLRDFDVTVPRLGLSAELRRFTAAAALGEAAMHFVAAEPSVVASAVVVEGLDQLNRSRPEDADLVALASLWHLVSALGFAPSLDACARCGAVVADGEAALFHHQSGGVICAVCSRLFERDGGRLVGGRRLPADARGRVAAWVSGQEALVEERGVVSDPELRAHQRLLREFLAEHLSERRPLRALAAWSAGTAHVL
jgi:DNA repair protein RecO (recombination protein O)